jgi:hypothetical protein
MWARRVRQCSASRWAWDSSRLTSKANEVDEAVPTPAFGLTLTRPDVARFLTARHGGQGFEHLRVDLVRQAADRPVRERDVDDVRG